MKQIVEGLLRNDLDQLVLPILDIDIYESKIDDERSIVVAFYVFENEPARDLDNFISKSSLEILDVETSPAPTSDGYYVVFVEIERNFDFPETLTNLLKEINNLVSTTDWQFKTFSQKNIFDVSEENLKTQVNLNPQTVASSSREVEDTIDIEKQSKNTKEKSVSEQAVPILKSSLVESIYCEADVLTLSAQGRNYSYRVVQISDREPSTPILIPHIGDTFLNESMKLSALLGNSYCVDVVNNGLLISSDQGYLVVEPFNI